MSSLATSTTPTSHSTTHHHAGYSTHPSPPLSAAPPVLQTSCMTAKDGHSDADMQPVPSSALFISKAGTSAMPLNAKPFPSRGATHHHVSTGGVNVSTAADGAPTPHSNPGSSTAAHVSSSSPTPGQQQSHHCMPVAYPWNLGAPQAVADKMEASVLNKGRICTLTYSPSRGAFRITRMSSSGKTRTVLNIPVRLIINIETAAERDARQRARQANDDTIRLVFAENSRGTGSLLCSFPSGTGEDNEALVFAHSRVNTASSTVGIQSGSLHRRTSSRFSTYADASLADTTAPGIRYYMHYVRQRNKGHPSIHTLEFQSNGSAEAVRCVVSQVVERIYQKGSKHIIVFISTKSGKGKGEHIFEKQVRPLLHFSRHTFHAYVTRRAHDCEDYVANLENPMSHNTVIATVGGDGMIHETVNGMHRRKLALVRWLRSVTTEVSTGDTPVVSSNMFLQLNDNSSCAEAGARILPALCEGIWTVTPTELNSINKAALHNEAISGSHLPFIQLGWEEKKHNGDGRSGATSSVEETAREAHRLAHCLVQNGWDALMPLVATVATGSACGLAKSLDILSVAEAALSLVHLSTVHMDLLMMKFTPNEDMLEFHRGRMSAKRLEAAKRKFSQYEKDKAVELQERSRLKEEFHRHPQTLTAAEYAAPFLKDGSSVFRDAVSCATRMPELHSRVAFMSLSFGAANDIDHGSESLRWMGNARFHVYGGYMILRGLRGYQGILRYLPWESKAGKTVEKLHPRSRMPSTDDFPLCTMREGCMHCCQYKFTPCGASPLSSSTQVNEAQPGPTSNTSRGGVRASSAAATLAPYTDRELLHEEVVDFNDEHLPWVTIRGDFCFMLMCNLRDIAQDMLMAPLAHMSDGAIDVVYCRFDPTTGRRGRMEMLKFFMSLESGSHVNLEYVSYVKARALEIKVDAGISMSDGELMPLSSVRVTKMRGSVQLVRSE